MRILDPTSPLKVSVIVCTYNRADHLRSALGALHKQQVDPQAVEILVVDNNSTDATQAVVEEFAALAPNVKYVKETAQGLAHARNKGLYLAKAPLVAFLDDDARVLDGWFAALFKAAELDYDCFGGPYKAWHLKNKPAWFKEEYASTLGKQNISGDLGDGLWLDGGNIVFKTLALDAMGGFPVNLGMSGQTLAYGEEIPLQVRIRAKGGKLGFFTDMAVEHAVQPHKYSPSFFLKQAVAVGKASFDAFLDKPDFAKTAKALVNVVAQPLLRLPENLASLIFGKMKVENFIIETFSPGAENYGRFLAGLKRSLA